MQHAMWVGRHDSQPLGGVAGHLYVEFDGGAIDYDRLVQAATSLALRHPMLRVRFLRRWNSADRCTGAQPTIPLPSTTSASSLTTPPAERLIAIRHAKSHQQLDGQVFELTLSLLPGEKSRLHVDLDMQAADAMSYRTLMTDLAALYRGPAISRNWASATRSTATRSCVGKPSRGRLTTPIGTGGHNAFPNCPTRPRCRRQAERRCRRNSSRRWQWLDPETRDALFAHARAHGVTPAMMFAAAFSHTLACWSSTSRFLLNVPLFGREALHPDVAEPGR